MNASKKKGMAVGVSVFLMASAPTIAASGGAGAEPQTLMLPTPIFETMQRGSKRVGGYGPHGKGSHYIRPDGTSTATKAPRKKKK
jgi:hypothetical protein